jgi:hypothetical protein
VRTLEATEATTSAHDVGQADVEGTRNAGEAPRDARKEGEVLPGPQMGREEPPRQPPQQHQEERPLEPQPEAEWHEPGQPKEPAGEAEQEAVVLAPEAQEEVLARGGRSHPKGRRRA